MFTVRLDLEKASRTQDLGCIVFLHLEVWNIEPKQVPKHRRIFKYLPSLLMTIVEGQVTADPKKWSRFDLLEINLVLTVFIFGQRHRILDHCHQSIRALDNPTTQNEDVAIRGNQLDIGRVRSTTSRLVVLNLKIMEQDTCQSTQTRDLTFSTTSSSFMSTSAILHDCMRTGVN